MQHSQALESAAPYLPESVGMQGTGGHGAVNDPHGAIGGARQDGIRVRAW